MNIEKVLEEAFDALFTARRIICNECSLKDGTQCKHDGAVCHDIRKILQSLSSIEALEELSKPSGDDALKTVHKIRNSSKLERYGIDEDYVFDEVLACSYLQQFAIDYHSKQCAECTQKYWATAPKSYPLTEPPEATK